MQPPWTDHAPHRERPDEHQLLLSQQRIRFVPVPVTSPAVLELVDVFRTLMRNGGAAVAAFDVVDADDTATWFLGRNRFEEYGFGSCLVRSAGLSAAMPEAAEGGVSDDVEFTFSSPLSLDGRLAEALTWGGAYADFSGRGAEAKALGVAFSEAVVGDRYDDFRVDRTVQGWSPWFRHVVWNGTWIITDLRLHRSTVLCVTDVD